MNNFIKKIINYKFVHKTMLHLNTAIYFGDLKKKNKNKNKNKHTNI